MPKFVLCALSLAFSIEFFANYHALEWGFSRSFLLCQAHFVDWVLISQLSVLLCRFKAIMCFKLGTLA